MATSRTRPTPVVIAHNRPACRRSAGRGAMHCGRGSCAALALALIGLLAAAHTSQAGESAGALSSVVDVPAARRRMQLETPNVDSYASCQAASPAECGFYYSTMETILFSAGVIEFSWFSGICSERCLNFISESDQCQQSPETQQLALSVCQAYSCSYAVESACGEVAEGEMVDHSLACSEECTAAMDSAGCVGAGEILPAFGKYQSNLGETGQECKNHMCQQMLSSECSSYNNVTRNMPRSSLCGTKCYEALLMDECLNADINLVAEEGTFISKWVEHASDPTYWGPDAVICSEFVLHFTAAFPDLQMAALTEPGAMDQFTDDYVQKLTDLLEQLGMDPEMFLINIINVTAGSVEVGTEIIFHSEEDLNLFQSLQESFASFFNLSFQEDMGEAEISNITVVEPPTLPIDGSSSALSPSATEAPDLVDTTVRSTDPVLDSDPGGPNWAVIAGVACAGGLTVLAMVGLSVYVAKKKKEPEAEEGVMYNNPVAGTEQQPPPPDM